MDTIESLKAEISRLRMIVAEQRDSIKRLSGMIKEYEEKEKNISSAIHFATQRSNQIDNSMRKLYELDIQRFRLLYARMDRVLNEVYMKYPELKKETKLKDMISKFRASAYDSSLPTNFTEEKKPAVTEDPVRKLLNNIITYIDKDKKETATLPRAKTATSALDAINNEYANYPSFSGFNINEALNPTESLEDILKSFNLDSKQDK